MKEKRKSETQRELGLRHRFINVINRYSLKKGRLIREKTGIEIKNKILKYDARPFASDMLRDEIKRRII